MLARLWKNLNPVRYCWKYKVVQPLWKRVQQFLKTFKIVLPYDPAMPLLDIDPKELKLGSWRAIYTPLFTATFFKVTKMSKQPKCPLMDEQISKLQSIDTMECYSAFKMKEILQYATIWMNTEKSQSWRYMVWLHVDEELRVVKIIKPGAERMAEKELLFNGNSFHLTRWKVLWGWIVVMIAHNHVNVFNSTELYIFKWFRWYTKINSKCFKNLNARHDTIKLLEDNIGKTFSDINRSNIFLDQSPEAKEIENKNKQMGPNQTSKLLHSKGNHQWNEKTTSRMGENICQWCDCEGINFQNKQKAHTAQYQKTK